MDSPDLFSAPFLALQSGKFGLNAQQLLVLPVQSLPPVDDSAWAAPLSVLRQTRNREFLRIAARALAGAALAETLGDLSRFADAAIQAAAQQAAQLLQSRHGVPRNAKGQESRLIVLGMGKLGGAELNFSSDIDLICAYSDPGDTDGERSLDNGQYFVKLVQEMVRLLATATEDGFVFRVDLMLRPFGSASPVAIAASAMEEYYQSHGREWERYALIKARPVAGDLAMGRLLLKRLKPFVFRRYLDFDAINALRDLKARIGADAATRGVPSDDLKVGLGGIRECEFVVQSFQLVRGGQDPRLRQQGWAATLAVLSAQGLLAEQACEDLRSGYELLRRVENAVQIWSDAQTHALPQDEPRRAWLALAMGEASWSALNARLKSARAKVAAIFSGLFAESPESDSKPVKAAVAAALAGQNDDCDLQLEHLGFDGEGADEVRLAMQQLRASPQLRAAGASTLPRLNALLPLLLEDAQALRTEQLEPATAFTRALNVVAAVLGRSTYLTLLRESAQARRNLLAVVAASPAISIELSRHPVLLDQLLDARTLYTPPTREQFRDELLPRMEAIAVEEIEDAMNLLRQEVREARLRIAAASAVAQLPLVKVSDALTWLAEASVEAAIAFTWRVMTQAHGAPHGASGQSARFIGIGYGKLGALEMGFGSDLDMVFAHDAQPPDADTVGGVRPLPQSTWMSRLAQKLIGLITTQTHLGRAYEVDLQLRPNGSSGLPVVTLAGFAVYLQQHAWTWEHQALTRARFIAGDASLGAEFSALRLKVLCIERDSAKLAMEIAEMRQKMRVHLARPKAQSWNIKHGVGGLVDVEFLVAHAVLLHAHAQPSVAEYSDVWRQIEALVAVNALSVGEGETLLNAQRAYRAGLHQRALQGTDAEASNSEFAAERGTVTAIWQQRLGPT